MESGSQDCGDCINAVNMESVYRPLVYNAGNWCMGRTGFRTCLKRRDILNAG